MDFYLHRALTGPVYYLAVTVAYITVAYIVQPFLFQLDLSGLGSSFPLQHLLSV